MKGVSLIAVLLLFAAATSGRAQTAPPLPPAAQEAMRKGTLAAGQKQWAVALRYFGQARDAAPEAPQPLFNCGLAEAQVPGRELRAIAWFRAYLVLAPDAPNAAAVREQIDALDIVAEGRAKQILTRLKQYSTQVPNFSNQRSDALAELAALTARMAAPIPAPATRPEDVPFTTAQRAEAWTAFVRRDLAAPLFTDFQPTLDGVAAVSASADNRAWTIFSATRNLADIWLARLADVRGAGPEADLGFAEELKVVTAFVPQLAARSGITLIPIATGEFTMGLRDYSWPPHRVTISRPFFLGVTEVTQAQWTAVMGSNPSEFKGDTLPVEQVSWDDAMAFCKKLTERERAAGGLPAGWEFTLPTEAQWEYAGRAGTTGDYAGNLDAMAWYDKNSVKKTHPVGTKQANAWGLFDMHGNVGEWCADWFAEYPGWRSVADPAGPASGSGRVLRSGSWYFSAEYCRSDHRINYSPGTRYNFCGFRLALSSVR